MVGRAVVVVLGFSALVVVAGGVLAVIEPLRLELGRNGVLS
jgi:hypothetical protein